MGSTFRLYLISTVTDAVLETVVEWQNRPLEPLLSSAAQARPFAGRPEWHWFKSARADRSHLSDRLHRISAFPA